MKSLNVEKMEVVCGGATACETEASRDGLSTLATSIAAGAAGALFTGGLSVVVGVIAGTAAAATAYVVSYATCKE